MLLLLSTPKVCQVCDFWSVDTENGLPTESFVPGDAYGRFVIDTIRILCEDNPSLGTAIVNGLLAWTGVLGGCTVLFSGLPAVVALFIPSRPTTLSRRINRGLGQGLLVGILIGPPTLFVFIARIVT